MPEGPSILLMKEKLLPFVNQKIDFVSGNAETDKSLLLNQKLLEIRTFGKQTYLIFAENCVRIHLMMFGSFSIGEQTKPDKNLRLGLRFEHGNLYFYSCCVKVLPVDFLESIPWEADVLSENWSSSEAKKKLKQFPEEMVADALLDQNIFAGVGNIIKNEILFRIGVHPESKMGKLPTSKVSELIKEARNYSFDFLEWKKAFVLRKHWQVYKQKNCPVCGEKLIKKPTGKGKRTSFFCEIHQVLYK